MTQYTVKEAATLSGVSVRTLHHYDEIGLLRPAAVGANGYRYYGREELLRLQQILFHRELGFALDDIRVLLDDPKFDRIAALRTHRIKLEDEAKRYRDLVRTIDRTIVELNGDKAMKDKELYEGFSAEKQARWEKEIVDRYGDSGREKIEESKRNFAKMSPADMAEGKAEMEAIHAAFAQAMVAGHAPDAADVQALTARHYKWVCRAWKPNRGAYIGMGQLYVQNPEFRALYDGVKPGLAEFMAEAMKIYAEKSLND